MGTEDHLSGLIGDIYDAALDQTLWTSVLHRAADFTGGQAAGLLSKDTVSKLGNAHFHFGVEERYIELYRETYWKFDPLSPLLSAAVGEIISILDVTPLTEYHEGRFYREWVRPQGWLDAANVVLDKSVTSLAILSIIRSESRGEVDEAMRDQMNLLVPHFRRAVTIGRIIDFGRIDACMLTDTLDSLSAGMFLVDASGRIVHANVAGQVMLKEKILFRAASGRLTTADPRADDEIRETIAAAGMGDDKLGATGIVLPLSESGDQRVIHILPLTGGARRGDGRAYSAVAALFVHKAAFNAPSPLEMVARRYALTPTELRVLLAIVEVGGVPEAAEALGVAGSTIKTHLSRVFEKTGAKRQADLVKIVAGFSNPLVS